MAVQDAFAPKRKLLVEALATCAEVATREHDITIDTLRSLFASAMSEWWREGELRLDPAWKMLCNQPGLTPQAVAPPLLLMRSYESKLDVKVRLPDALSAIPPSEQQRLLDTIDQATRDRVLAVIEQAKITADKEQAEADKAQRDRAPTATRPAVPAEPAKTPSAPTPSAARQAQLKQQRLRKAAFVLFPLSLVTLAIALFISLRPTATPFDLTPHATILKMSSAKRDGKSLNAVIADPKWNAANQQAKEKIVRDLLESLIANGINVVTLQDENERVRAIGYLIDNKINVVIR